MANEHKLTIARNALGLTQRELGLRVSELVGTSISEAHAQKKVSYWEGGHAKPTKAEISALSEVLKRTENEIESWFVRLPSVAEDLFTELSSSKQPCLIAACYSGAPAGARNPAVADALVEGICRNVSLAMFFPFPLSYAVDNKASTAADLPQHYGTIWTSVRTQYEILFSRSGKPAREDHLALYVPSITFSGTPANVLLPPGSSRYTLVVQQTAKDAMPTRSLYIWVEGERLDGLYKVGTFAAQDIYQPQLLAWQAYFGAIIERWLRNKNVLPSGVAEPWSRYASPLQG